MKTLFHGATLNNWEGIKQNGFDGTEYNWYCSDLYETYFYDIDKTGEEDNLDWAKNECIRNAFESAQLAAAIQNYMGSTLVVLELLVEDHFCQDDFSCENMSSIATTVQNEDLDLSMITKVHVSDNSYIPSLRLLYCFNLIQNNPHINTSNFSSVEL